MGPRRLRHRPDNLTVSKPIISRYHGAADVEGARIVGVGYEGFRPAITDISTRELMFEAASKAYDDAGVDPRKDVGSFICCTEDLWEGWSITDEMVPDQVGGARKPLCTVPADGITGLGHAVMQIRAGAADVIMVEAHSKVADVLDKRAVENMGLDPAFHRVVEADTDVVAGLEMSAFMDETGFARSDVSRVVASAKKKGMRNPRASYAGLMRPSDVSSSNPVAEPLLHMDRAEYAEGGVVLVVASESWAKKKRKNGVRIDGITWRSGTPWHEGGSVGAARYANDCFSSVNKQTRKSGVGDYDILEVDDLYSYKLLQHLVSIGASKRHALDLAEGKTGHLNPGGGSLACGNLIEATGLHKVLECVLQLRGEAGGCQVKGARSAFALSWRGHPTATGAAVALSMGAGN